MHQPHIIELKPASNSPEDLFRYCVLKAKDMDILEDTYMHSQWANKLFSYERNSSMRNDLMSKVKHEYATYFTRDMKYSFVIEKLERDFPKLLGLENVDDEEDGYTVPELIDETLTVLKKEIDEQKDPSNIESFKAKNLNLISTQGRTYVYRVTITLLEGQEPHFHDGEPFKLKIFGDSILCEIVDYDYDTGHLFFTSNRRLNSASFCTVMLDSTFILEGLAQRLNAIKGINGIDDMPFTKFLFDETSDLRNIDHKKVPYRISKYLDEAQKESFNAAIDNDITFIWGPPGTGKSYTLAAIIYALFELREDRTAVCCLSNVAVDQLLNKVVDIINEDGKILSPGNIYRAGRTKDDRILATDYLFPQDSITDQLRKRIKRNTDSLKLMKIQKMDMMERAIMLKAENKELRNQLKEHTDYLVKKSRVVFSTISNFILSDSLNETRFDNLIVDEASMLATPSLIALGSKITKRLIMVGDFQQLSPIAMVKNQYLTDSVFEMNGIDINETDHPALHQLLHQRRSDEKIVNLINGTFYNRKLIPSVKGDAHIINSEPHPGKIISLEKVDDGAIRFTKGGTRQNKPFANRIINLLRECALYDTETFTIGVITPYKGQVSLLRALFREQDFSSSFEKRVKIGTIHTFQGSECDVIIYDMVDCFYLENGRKAQIGRLYAGKEGERLLNVAVSRAKHKLIVVCDPEYISNIPGNTVTNKTRKVFESLYRFRYC